MSSVTLIRHGLTDWNVTGRFQGHTDRELSADGREQARQLARYLEPVTGATVYSSPLRRARETAEIAFPGQEIRPPAETGFLTDPVRIGRNRSP